MSDSRDAEIAPEALSAWDFKPSWGWGTLRVCSDDALIEVEMMYGESEDQVKAVVTDVAAELLSTATRIRDTEGP
jgi:hypothetical protein